MMSQTRTIKVNTELSTIGSKGIINSRIPLFENLDIRFYLNLTVVNRNEFYRECNSGDLIAYINSGDGFYFDLNKEGELIAIYPEKYTLSINSEGELLISEK